MPSSRTRGRARLAALTTAGLALAGLQLSTAPSAEAISTGLVIREVYGAGGNPNAPYNADFVELYNPTASPISLSGLGLHYRNVTGAVGGNNVVALAGTVPAGKPFLVQMDDAGAVGADLPEPDQVAAVAINMSSTNGQVLLLPNTTPFAATGNLAGNAGVIDMVGYGPGSDPNFNNSFETAPTAILSNITSAARTTPFTDTDDNSADFVVGAPTPEHTGVIVAADPGDQTGQVGEAITEFDLTASGGTPPYTWDADNLPPGVDVASDGTVSGTPTAAGSFTVTATATDSAAPTPATDDVEFTFVIDPAPSTDIQILATNDFHGRIQNDAASASAGAAVLAGAVKQLRTANPNTVFAAAGDLIGASTFESFILNDKPTIDALNSAGLEVSAVGNHELDQGYDDLINRVMAVESPSNPDGGAGWQYIAANLKMKATGDPAVPATWVKTMDGVEVGFVGAVTEELPALVSPAGIADIQVDDIVDSVNEATADLKADGADIVIMLVHEGSPSTDCATMSNPSTTWGHIVTGVSDDVDAIVSGHTHLAYNCSFGVPGWTGRAVTERPVVSAGQYGTNLNQLVFTVDDATGEVTNKTQAILALKTCSVAPAASCGAPPSTPWTNNYPTDSATDTIVQAAVTAAGPLGDQELGKLGGPFARAKFAAGGENRGGESTLGNLVAEVQRHETPAATVGAAQIAFMNPGGLRADMVGTVAGSDRNLTYKQAANVQPFANTLVNMDLTGAQIKKVLEQQWQRTSAGAVPTRAFLRLGVSKGFTYTYTQQNDPVIAGAKLGTVTGMWLNGVPINPATSYSVTVNSFLAAGGDNFRELANGTTKQDTGVTDLQAMVDYMAEFGTGTGLPVDSAQRAVGVAFPAGAPASYRPGDHVVLDLSSLSMTDPGDVKDTQVSVSLGGTNLGTAAVTTTVSSSPDNSANSNDDAGTAHVDVLVPAGTPAGAATLTITGPTTGTQVLVPITVAAPPPPPAPSKSTTTAKVQPQNPKAGQKVTLKVTVKAKDGSAVTGKVKIKVDGKTKTVTLKNGKATVNLGKFSAGSYKVTVSYLGSDTVLESKDTVKFTVKKKKK